MKGLRPEKLRNRHLFAADSVAVILSTFVAFLVRFEDASWIVANQRTVIAYLVVSVPLRLAIFYAGGLYRRLWRHASIGELRQILLAGLTAGCVCAFIGLVLLPASQITTGRVPFSVVFIDAFLTTAAVSLPRLLARTMRPYRNGRRRRDDHGKRVLIIGAGDSAKQVVKELH